MSEGNDPSERLNKLDYELLADFRYALRRFLRFSEEAAREKLAERWAEFPGQKRTECVGVSRIGGLPSYIEVLTCLELAQDLERIRSSPAETTGYGGGNN